MTRNNYKEVDCHVQKTHPRRSLGALLGLSWGSLEQAVCLANLSFTEAKARVAKMVVFDYKTS